MADEPEVHKEEPAKSAGEKDAGKVTPGKGGSSEYFKKHKAAILAVGAGILIAAYFLLRNKGGTAAAATPAATTAGIDPATGYQYGSPADLAALGASGSQASTPSAPSATSNIDPVTGYVYGSPQDVAALQAAAPVTAGIGTPAPTFTPNPLTVGSFTTQGGTYSAGTPISTFQQQFAATGQNAGQIVPGGTGQPIPLPKGKSYTK
jgi:hypothetical protein